MAPDPGRFHFYQHLPPWGADWRETFDRVLLRFWRGEYRDPEWFSYRIIPTTIQSARLVCAVKGRLLGAPWALFQQQPTL